jgi:hypothetical protein
MMFRTLSSIAFGVFLASSAFAQLTSQTALVGTVTDSTGSVVPGAVVVAVNAGTQDTYEGTTNAQGQYNFQFVRTGRYTVTVTLAGFQTFKVTGIEVANNQVVRRDAVLQVGDIPETLQVVAQAIVLDTDKAAISESLNQRLISEAPLSGGRNVWALAGTTPGVLGGTNSFTGAGQRALQNSLSLDGINAAANFTTQTTMRPIADAVTEVQVQTGSTSAEYGSYLGVHVNVVTKENCGEVIVNCISADAFRMPAAFTWGNTPRNILRGPGRVTTDLSLGKNFPLAGRAQLQVRAEAFNLLNRVNFNNPNATFGTANFGRITAAQSMRQVQLGAKILV